MTKHDEYTRKLACIAAFADYHQENDDSRTYGIERVRKVLAEIWTLVRDDEGNTITKPGYDQMAEDLLKDPNVCRRYFLVLDQITVALTAAYDLQLAGKPNEETKAAFDAACEKWGGWGYEEWSDKALHSWQGCHGDPETFCRSVAAGATVVDYKETSADSIIEWATGVMMKHKIVENFEQLAMAYRREDLENVLFKFDPESWNNWP